jgi:hypothetical protein
MSLSPILPSGFQVAFRVFKSLSKVTMLWGQARAASPVLPHSGHAVPGIGLGPSDLELGSAV